MSKKNVEKLLDTFLKQNVSNYAIYGKIPRSWIATEKTLKRKDILALKKNLEFADFRSAYGGNMTDKKVNRLFEDAPIGNWIIRVPTNSKKTLKHNNDSVYSIDYVTKNGDVERILVNRVNGKWFANSKSKSKDIVRFSSAYDVIKHLVMVSAINPVKL